MKIRYDNKQDASIIKLTELKQLSKVCKVTKLSQKLPEMKTLITRDPGHPMQA